MAQSSSSAMKQQHHGINGVIKPIAADLIPPPGPITIVPGLYPVDYFISPIREANPEVEITDLSQDTVGLIWTDIGSKGAAEKLSEVLNTHSKIGWVQFPMAGIEKFEEVIKAHANIVWTSAKGTFGQPVAEHALALILALLRNLPRRIRAKQWEKQSGLSLFGSKVTILGAGGIAIALLHLLAPFNVEVTLLRRRAQPLEDELIPPALKGKVICRSFKELPDVLPDTDVLVLAAALTAETTKIIGEREFELLPRHAIVVNVARGKEIDTDALVDALQKGTIAGAGVDVTDPEPLPDDHPLWHLQRATNAADDDSELPPDQHCNFILTPHTADTAAMCIPLLAERFTNNVTALLKGNGHFQGVVNDDYHQTSNSKMMNQPDPSLSLPPPVRGSPAVYVPPEQQSEEDKKWMREALLMAEEAFRAMEVPVGSVFVRHGKIIAKGRNRTNELMNATRHAELEAIDEILQKYPPSSSNFALAPHDCPEGDNPFKDTILYVTVEPCIMCGSALRQVGIQRVVFGCGNERFGGNGSVLGCHDDPALISSPPYEAVGGYYREEAIMLLRRFYLTENSNAPNPRNKAKRVLKTEVSQPGVSMHFAQRRLR